MKNEVKLAMKTCSRCGTEKASTAFPRNRTRKDGRGARCKACDKLVSATYRGAHLEQTRETVRRWRAEHPEKARASDARYYAAHAEAAKKHNAAYYAANFETVAAVKALHKKKNRAKYNRLKAAEKARKLQATPGWTNHVAVGEFYAFAVLQSKLAGKPYHVDHIVPLKNPRVCGLHTHYNLQVLPAKENISKGNRHWPDMPEQGARP